MSVRGTAGIRSDPVKSLLDRISALEQKVSNLQTRVNRDGLPYPLRFEAPIEDDTLPSFGTIEVLNAITGEAVPLGGTGAQGPPGPPGADGIDGVDGAPGAPGADGADGADGAPGADGVDGTDGVDGCSVLTGTGTPAGGLGKNCDTYINLADGELYTKSGGSWTDQASLIGPAGPTGPGISEYANTTARDAAFPSPALGDACFVNGNFEWYDGSGWLQWDKGWTDWSTSVTLTNITKGNGTVAAWYRRLGSDLQFKFSFKMGSTSAMGTTPTISVPFNMATDLTGTAEELGFPVRIGDVSAGIFSGVTRYLTASTISFYCYNASAAVVIDAGITSTVPMTWTTNDDLVLPLMQYRMSSPYV